MTLRGVCSFIVGVGDLGEPTPAKIEDGMDRLVSGFYSHDWEKMCDLCKGDFGNDCLYVLNERTRLGTLIGVCVIRKYGVSAL